MSKSALLLLAGCSSVVELNIEPKDGARSMVLAVEASDAELALSAHDDLTGPIRVTGDVIWALFYDRPLVELRLDPGTLTPDLSGGFLAPPDQLLRITPDGSEPLPELPARLADLRVRQRDPCVSFEPTFLHPAGAEVDGPQLVLDLGGAGALLVSTRGRWFRIDDAGSEELPEQPADLPLAAGHYDLDRDEIWLLGTDGRTAHGHPLRGFEAGPSLPVVSPRMWLAGSRAGEAFELFAMTASISIHRLDGDRWIELSPAISPSSELDTQSLARAGPGVAIATGSAPSEIVMVEGDRWQRVVVPVIDESDTHDQIRRARWIEDRGVLLGTSSGRLAARDSAWGVLVQPTTKTEIYTIAAYQGGLVFGGEDGVLNQAYPGVRECPAAQYGLVGDTPFHELVRAEGLLFAFPRIHPTTSLTVVELRPR